MGIWAFTGTWSVDWKTNSFSLGSHVLSRPSPCWNVDWFDLVQGATAAVQWGHFDLSISINSSLKLHSNTLCVGFLTPNRELCPALGTESMCPPFFFRSVSVKANLSGKKQDWQCWPGEHSRSSQLWQQAASVFLGTSSILWHSDMCQPLGFSRAPPLETLLQMEISLSSQAIWVIACFEAIGQRTREPEMWRPSSHLS